MNIIWLGHGSFRIEIEDQVVLIDPWLTGNPMLDAAHHEKAIEGATQVLVTHGHFDHTQDIADVAKRTGRGLRTPPALTKAARSARAMWR